MPRNQDHPFLGQAARAAGAAGRHGLGLGRGHARGPADATFADAGDPAGTSRWAREHGWTAGDDHAAEVAGRLLATAPLRRLGPDHRPVRVRTGRPGDVPALAFDVELTTAAGGVPEAAVTALAVDAPTVRLSPARLWVQGAGRWVAVPSGDPDLDARWRLLCGPDDVARLQPLAADPVLRASLLGTDDGDDLWTAAGFLAALRPDWHRPQLLDHHLGLLTVVRQALARLAG
ncbi:hypothetical protein [Modestobacter italicus]|uniref:hypothetical protein n=1 Tax=Modestobacter italicus (strain DSM 44449 / CECT 9708 / BC 501) TaxID=2732864 RepID=UPI001C98DB67|nr:hypothetical protein [Modestobacter italicus]